ncbi:ChaC-domain-containing protein [Aspergillus sclerotioniger CBS 115572]|uniref:glutathione-specific gamma-glutamylcyclotransferase n=1 Tax=Aspergillus sclerotioniger CBS 115572 TaxID=1450535 RepID=A0A317VBR2_9EURO|nr:ChaC-domain-containing protein [Aspergillus sclerotioniger CBS 115572]PWY70392.1 ChaC-domain-containing protein [Aspergillus sclerotioniger CBS 115572]
MVSSEGTPAVSSEKNWRENFPDGDLWVFGYGSLIWKPPPHFDQRVPGYINGYVRRFWQASNDHRGTPEKPGRVVTVIEREFWETLDDPLAHHETSPSATIWGAAYHIPASHANEVRHYLDIREINGYTDHYTPFHPVLKSQGSDATEFPTTPITCMVYIGQPTNSQFLREPAQREQQAVAEVISRSEGKSGKNAEYLFMLEKALEGLGLGNAEMHITDLVRRVKALQNEDEVRREEEKAERVLEESLHPSEQEAHWGFPPAE